MKILFAPIAKRLERKARSNARKLIIYLPYLIVYQQNNGFDFREVLQPNQSTQKEKKLLAECKKLFKIGNSYLRAFLKTVLFLASSLPFFPRSPESFGPVEKDKLEFFVVPLISYSGEFRCFWN